MSDILPEQEQAVREQQELINDHTRELFTRIIMTDLMNYLLILTIAHFLYRGKKVRLHTLLFDEAFYGIDAGRRDQLLGFATDLDLQLFVASPDQDGVRREISHSTTLFVVKDTDFNVHLRDFHWENPDIMKQPGLFDEPEQEKPITFGEEL